MSDGNGTKKITVKYLFPDDFNPDYVTGVWGGLTPSAAIIANFFFERKGLPREQSLTLGEDGRIQETVTDPPDHATELVRYVSSGVVMNLDAAKAIYHWLGSTIAAAEKVKAARENKA